MVEQDEKLWESQHPEVLKLRNFAKEAFLAVPSSTQFVELAVKEGDNIAACNRGENDVNAIAVVRSFMINPLNRQLRDDEKSKTKRANQYTSGGAIGERDMKKKSKAEDSDSRYDVSGSKLSAAYIRKCLEIDSWDFNDSDKESIKLLKKNMLDASARFSVEVQKKAAEKKRKQAAKKRLQKKKLPKVPKRCIPERTAVTAGRIPFSQLTKATHTEVLKGELDIRGLVYSSNETFAKLREKLRASVKKESDGKLEKEFHPMTKEMQAYFSYSILDSK